MRWRRKRASSTWTDGDWAIIRAALDQDDAERGVAMLDAAGISMIDVERVLQDSPELTPMPAPPADEVDLPPAPPGPEPLSVMLPDSTDLTDPAIQRRVEARVSQTYGVHAVVMWPRFPDVEDGIPPVVPIRLAREAARTVRLGPDARPTDGQRLAAHGERQGWGELVEFDPYRRTAVFARLDTDVAAIRSRLAALLKTEPWQVEVVAHRIIDGKTGEERLDQVVVLRTPPIGTSAEKRASTWRDLVPVLPGGSSGWEVLDDPVTGTVRLRYGQPRRLPERVAMVDLLPEAIDTSAWSHLTLGLTPEGREAFVDLTAGPHALLVGPTGAGKSVALRQYAAAALCRGHRLVIIDAVKDGLDFAAFKPWCTAFADDGIVAAKKAIEAVYTEGQRRKRLLKRYDAPSWVDLPADVRQREDIQPLTVIFDEFMSAVIPQPVPRGLDKEDPMVTEANELNAAKATILAMVGKIARELRFVGVHLAIALQRADTGQLAGFGEIRSNLTSGIQLVKPGTLPAQETLRMVFPGDQTHAATETIMELDDGASKGLATVAADGGDVHGFRVAFGTPSEIPALLEQRGVPKPQPWRLDDRTSGPEPAPFEPIPTAENRDEVRDLGVHEVSLDDLEGDDEFEAPTKPRKSHADLSDLF